MGNDKWQKLLGMAMIVFAVLGAFFLSRWLVSIPFDVIAKSLILEVFAVMLAMSAIALKITMDISLQWTIPVFVAAVYMGLTPLINYSAVPFHREDFRVDAEFYGQPWFHFMVVTLIAIIGYGLIWHNRQTKPMKPTKRNGHTNK